MTPIVAMTIDIDFDNFISLLLSIIPLVFDGRTTRFLARYPSHNPFLHAIAILLFIFECHAGSSRTSVLGKALETSQDAQAEQKTAGSRGFGNGLSVGNGHNVILSIGAYQTLQICLSSEVIKVA
jgi:hypothetical protein